MLHVLKKVHNGGQKFLLTEKRENVLLTTRSFWWDTNLSNQMFRSSHPELFLRKGVLKICSKFAEEHLCRSAISIKSLCKATLLKSHFGIGVLL